MRQLVLGVALVMLAAGCGGPSVEPTAPPTPTPDPAAITDMDFESGTAKEPAMGATMDFESGAAAPTEGQNDPPPAHE